MSQPTSTLSKFVGLTSLGLLTGSSLTLSLLTTPTLLSLPSTNHASQALSILTARADSLDRILRRTSLIALAAAWALSPRVSRHPYLLWTALPVCGVTFWEVWTGHSDYTNGAGSQRAGITGDPKGKGKSTAKSAPFGSGSEDEDGWRRVEEAEAAAGIDEINGESVRDGLLALRQNTTLRSAIYGFSFVLGLVGIWGDGY